MYNNKHVFLHKFETRKSIKFLTFCCRKNRNNLIFCEYKIQYKKLFSNLYQRINSTWNFHNQVDSQFVNLENIYEYFILKWNTRSECFITEISILVYSIMWLSSPSFCQMDRSIHSYLKMKIIKIEWTVPQCRIEILI